MKISELKDMTLVELAAKGRDLRQEIFNLRLQQASAQLEKPASLHTLRRDIARIPGQRRGALLRASNGDRIARSSRDVNNLVEKTRRCIIKSQLEQLPR